MIRPLRKRHWQIWISLTLLIPAGILAAVLVRPHIASGQLVQPGRSMAQPIVIKEISRKDYEVRLRGNAPGKPAQLEWINKQTLHIPTAVIYQAGPGVNAISRSWLIGRIESRGTYLFSLSPDSGSQFRFLLYDFIKEEIIDSIDFTSPQKTLAP